MHDTIDAAIRRAILAANPWSYLHVTRAPEEGDDPEAVVEDNAAAFRRLLGAGAFRMSEEPGMYVYRLRTPDHAQTGIVAEIPMTDFARGRILGHEEVKADRVAALVKHFSRVPGRSDLVALMHPSDAEVDGIVKSCCDGDPMLEIEPDDGLEQTLWRLDDTDAIAGIRECLGEPTLYITDGHHRVAASAQLWAESGRPDDLGVLCVLFPAEQMRILAFHRRIAGPLGPAVTLEKLRQRASVEPVRNQPVPRPGTVGLYLSRAWYRLTPRRRGGRASREVLDVTWLHRDVLEPVFSVRAPDDPRLELLPDLGPLAGVASRCDADGGVLFALAPPTLGRIVEVAERGEVMPPKTTYFDPKPRSGLFLRLVP